MSSIIPFEPGEIELDACVVKITAPDPMFNITFTTPTGESAFVNISSELQVTLSDNFVAQEAAKVLATSMVIAVEFASGVQESSAVLLQNHMNAVIAGIENLDDPVEIKKFIRNQSLVTMLMKGA